MLLAPPDSPPPDSPPPTAPPLAPPPTALPTPLLPTAPPPAAPPPPPASEVVVRSAVRELAALQARKQQLRGVVDGLMMAASLGSDADSTRYEVALAEFKQVDEQIRAASAAMSAPTAPTAPPVPTPAPTPAPAPAPALAPAPAPPTPTSPPTLKLAHSPCRRL